MNYCLIVFISSILLVISGTFINAFGKKEDQGYILLFLGSVMLVISSICMVVTSI